MNISPSTQTTQKAIRWSHEEIVLLLSLWEEFLPEWRAPKKNNYVYRQIAERLQHELHKEPPINALAVKSKLDTLKNQYSKNKKKTGTGSSPSPWRYYDQVHRILSSSAAYDQSRRSSTGMSSSPPPEELPVEVLTEEGSITLDTDSLPSHSQGSLVTCIEVENVMPISPSAALMNDEECTGMRFSNSGQDIEHLDSEPSSSANPRKRKRSAKVSNNHDFFIEYLQCKEQMRKQVLTGAEEVRKFNRNSETSDIKVYIRDLFEQLSNKIETEVNSVRKLVTEVQTQTGESLANLTALCPKYNDKVILVKGGKKVLKEINF